MVLNGQHTGPNRLVGTIEFVRNVGETVELMVQCGERRLNSMMLPKDRPDVREGAVVTVEFPTAATSLL